MSQSQCDVRVIAISLLLLSAANGWSAPPTEPARDAGVQAMSSSSKASVLIAAAGDISPNEIGAQRETSNLLLQKNYDAVLLLGDNQYPAGSFADYQAFFEPTWGRVKAKTFPVPGNHEYQTGNAAGYFTYFGARAGDSVKGYYSFDLGNWHLVALNTNTQKCGIVKCDSVSEQVKWLREDLRLNAKRSPGRRCILAFWHHPRFSSGASHGNFEGAQALWEVLAEFKADVVLNGHEHVYERFEQQTPTQVASSAGLRQFTVGTGGALLYEFGATKPNSAIRENKSFGILELELKPTAYSWKFISSNTQFTDSGETACH